MNNNKLTQAQLDSFWMPFSGNRDFKKDPRLLVSAEGSYYTDADGRKIFDGLSGLWCAGLGHGHPKIVEAVTKQVKELDYAPSFQFSHPKAFEFAEKIVEFMPNGLNRVFYTNSGSGSVETALKMARAYWHKKGMATKTKLIGRALGYHGVNFGGTAVGGIGGNRAIFGQGIEAYHLRHTINETFVKGQPKNGRELANELLDLIALHSAANIAALIVEPMAGSAGVIPPPVGYLDRLREICDEHNILLIFDEVITAFGRVGSKTGSEEFGVTPDIITIAKQMTNATIPMGAVVAKQEIYDTFMNNAGAGYLLEFPHGYTYSGHPIAAAAGLATLEILKEEKLIERVKDMSPYFEEKVHSLRSCKHIIDIRNYGFAAGFTLASAPGEPALRPYLVAMKMWKKGFYVRYGGATIQLGLPFATTKEEIDTLISALGETFDEID